MAPGTRSRRTDVLHRATPVMLKPKQRQTTLDQHLQQTRQQAPGAASSTRPPPLQAHSRQPRTLQQHKTPTAAPKQQLKPQQQKQHKQHKPQQTTPPSRQQTLFSFAVSPPTRNPLDTTDDAEPMSSARPKRKAAVDADADARGGDAKRGKAEAAAGASASDGFSSVEGVDDIMGTIVSDETLKEALRVRPRLAVEILDFTKAPAAQKQKQQQHYTLVGQGSQAPKPAGKAEKPAKHSTASQQRPLSPLSPPALRSLAANNTTKSSANIHTNPSLPITQHAAPAAPKTRQQAPAASQKQARDKAGSSTTTTAPQTATAAATGASTTQPRALKAAPKAEPHQASKSKEKLVNGIKHELKSLQLATPDAVDVASAPREGGRKLRSQEATRFKSELSAYFPEYDEVIGNEPKEEHLLNVDTPILFVEQIAGHPVQYPTPALAAPLVASLRSNDRMTAAPCPVKGYGDKLFYDVFDSHVLDFTFLGSHYKNKGAVDPLPDTCFEANHKRAERTERSIRNTEKGRAQHEKDQIIRLLDGLQGPDWLRTMGVSGITESKKKAFEPARDHFIRGCRTILGKFRTWSLEEKRRKMEKDRAHAEEVKAREAAAAASSAATTEPRSKSRAKADTAGGKSRKRVAGKEVPTKKAARAKSARDEAATTSEPADTDGDEMAAGAATADDDDESIDNDSQPDSSDFDAVIALQLRQEALARSRVASKLNQGPSASAANKRRRTQKDASSPHEPSPLSEELKEAKEPKEVKSFFEKPYQREAALSRSRRKGRTVMAWGQPVPEPPQNEFSLPGEVVVKDKDGESEVKETGRRTRGSTRSANK